VTLVQADTVWHDAAANRDRLARMMRAETSATDLFVLPETFSTGFSNAAVATAEGTDGETARWLLAEARALDAAITGSVQIRVGDQVFNRLLWAEPGGTLRHYDKRHLFRMAREQDHYAAGRERLVVEFRGWRICPLVCYDLRFPVFSRNRVRDGGVLDFDLLLYVANWPAPRHEAWRTLLRARAIENLCFVGGVNRCGTDGNGHPYRGGSALVDALGGTLVESDDAPGTMHHALSLSALREHRRRFPAHLDADGFTLEE
jgi:predicted amidohydrolase